MGSATNKTGGTRGGSPSKAPPATDQSAESLMLMAAAAAYALAQNATANDLRIMASFFSTVSTNLSLIANKMSFSTASTADTEGDSDGDDDGD